MRTRTALLFTVLDVRSHQLVSDQVEYPELVVIIRELHNVIATGTIGDIVELGCYVGTTSLFIQRLLQQLTNPPAFHAYDSFLGLPAKTTMDNSPAGGQFQQGELVASKNQLIKNFRQAGLRQPIIHKAWFEELTAPDIPTKIAFAFLDSDFYSSIASSLAVITPQLVPGATVIVDDYQSEALPGARRATDAWAKQHGQSVRTEKSLGIIRYSP